MTSFIKSSSTLAAPRHTSDSVLELKNLFNPPSRKKTFCGISWKKLGEYLSWSRRSRLHFYHMRCISAIKLGNCVKCLSENKSQHTATQPPSLGEVWVRDYAIIVAAERHSNPISHASNLPLLFLVLYRANVCTWAFFRKVLVTEQRCHQRKTEKIETSFIRNTLH